jgi:hypothetical protein
MSEFLSVSEAARQLGVRPRDISDLCYQRRLTDSQAPMIAGRRVIRQRCLGAVRHALEQAGKIPAEALA